jgi:hypothetical protein
MAQIHDIKSYITLAFEVVSASTLHMITKTSKPYQCVPPSPNQLGESFGC